MTSISDKITYHGYQRYYRHFFANVPESPTILEIGVDNGNSLALWAEYFVKPKVFAIDIDNKTVPEGVTFTQVDQSNESMLDSFALNKVALFDVIIDDGSHIPEHQMLTLNKLWKCLKPGGTYIIEDIETCYWQRSELYGYNFNANDRTTNIVKLAPAIIDSINRDFIKKSSRDINLSVFNDCESLMFGTNIICLTKRDNDTYGEYYDRPYRGKSKIDCNHPVRLIVRVIKQILKF